MAFVYILKSISKKRFYIGSTINLRRRLSEHYAGKVKSTRPLLPVQLVFEQECAIFVDARAIESRLKRFKRRDFIEKVIHDGRIRDIISKRP